MSIGPSRAVRSVELIPIKMFADEDHRPKPTRADWDRYSGYQPGVTDSDIGGNDYSDDEIAYSAEGWGDEIAAQFDTDAVVEAMRKHDPAAWREACLDVLVEQGVLNA